MDKRFGTCGPVSSRGFTLVEVAVVMLIVGLLLAGALGALNSQREVAQAKELDQQLKDIQEALLGFAATQGRLPRPATSATVGTERGACATEAECTGFLPWQALGMGASDPFGKRYRYSVSMALANAPLTAATIPTVVVNRTVQTRDGTGALVFLAGQAACVAGNPCAAAVIVSHGANRYGTSAVDASALADGSATNVDEDANATGTTNFIQRSATANTTANGGEFDDGVAWIAFPVLVNRLAQAGRL